MATRMSRMWAAFARTGDPNIPMHTRWEKFTPEALATMMFDVEDQLVHDPYKSEREALRLAPPAPFGREVSFRLRVRGEERGYFAKEAGNAMRRFANTAVTLSAIGLAAGSQGAPASPPPTQKIAQLLAELNVPDAELAEAEDVAAIRRLQRTVSATTSTRACGKISPRPSLRTRALLTPLAFSSGRDSIRDPLWCNIGDETIGIKDGLCQLIHMVLPAGGYRARRQGSTGALAGPGDDRTSCGRGRSHRPGQASWRGGGL